jgi:thiol-disulfide isomerase/thioredoxin
MNKNSNRLDISGAWRTCITVVFIALAMALFLQIGVAQEQKSEVKLEIKVEAPKILAVEFYADWCATCKELMPRMADIKKSYAGKQIMAVRFDMTDEQTKSQAAFLASYAGLEDAYRKGGGKTGFIVLVDAKTKKVHGLITKAKSVDEINKMLDDAVAKAGL